MVAVCVVKRMYRSLCGADFDQHKKGTTTMAALGGLGFGARGHVRSGLSLRNPYVHLEREIFRGRTGSIRGL
jgi:hypothetical protein